MNDNETPATAFETTMTLEMEPKLANATDLSHHLNVLSRSRHPSPLKDIIKFMAKDGMISLAGGLPHPSLFPVHNASFTVSAPHHTDEDVVLKLSNETTSLPPLSKFLQYGNCEGNADLRQWCLEFTKKIHSPAYKDFDVLLHPGNTNAWNKVVGMLCEKGDYILCESYTYPSAQALWIPNENFAAPIAMDAEGIIDIALEDTLANWSQTHPGVRRPHVLYLVSVGSNPTGVSMGAERRRRIYDICVKYDVIIVEDDPYFFLQYPNVDNDASSTPEYTPVSNDDFLSSLVPSFVRFDYQGRVIRLESFSKTLAPGLRLGYFVANPLFIERLLRATEVETQDPSGVSQALVLALLTSWTTSGYITWLQNLRLEYQKRRDWMMAAIRKNFDLVPATEFPALRAEGLVAAFQDPSGACKAPIPVFSFIPPTGGMFIWTKFYFSQNSRYQSVKDEKELDPEQAFANRLWAELAEELVLLTPGYYYHPWQGADKTSTAARGAEPDTSHFRLTFAMTTKEDMELGIERMANVLRRSWIL